MTGTPVSTPERKKSSESVKDPTRKNSLNSQTDIDIKKNLQKSISKKLGKHLMYSGSLLSESDSSDGTFLEMSESVANMKISRFSKLRKFSKGENFSRFCERFDEYVRITKIRDRDLYMLFLQNVDDETYTTLKSVKLSRKERSRASEFCKKYKTAIYGDEKLSLRHDVMDCKQKSEETISDYAYRLREKASIAYSDPENQEDNCLLAFLRGVKNLSMKIKLNEASLDNFNDAVKLAKKIERVEKVINAEPELNPILKEYSGYSPKNTENRNNKNTENRVRYASNSSEKSGSPIAPTGRSYSNESGYGPGNRNSYSHHQRNRSYSNDSDYIQRNRNRYSSQHGGRSYYSNEPNYIQENRNRYSRQYSPRFSDRSQNRGTNGWRGNSHRFKTCFGCSRKGHIQAFCWENPNNNSGINYSNNNHYARGSGIYRGNHRMGNFYNPNPYGQWHESNVESHVQRNSAGNGSSNNYNLAGNPSNSNYHYTTNIGNDHRSNHLN